MMHANTEQTNKLKSLIDSSTGVSRPANMVRRVANFLSDQSWEFGSPELMNQRVNDLGDVEFGFLEDEEMLSLDHSTSDHHGRNECGLDEMSDEDHEEKDGEGAVEEDKKFWENQHHVLQATLCRTSSLESRVRNAAKEALKEFQTSETVCACGKKMATGCRSCLMREVSGRLRNAGFDSAICKTKWRSSPNIPSGEHSFIDVIDKSSSKKGEVKIIVELNFRAEFEMAKANEEYNRLVRRLPEVFVGKIERLQPVIKILCLAAKKCMKEKKMHMGPWRKQRYMQAKWQSACERTASTPLLSVTNTIRLPKPKAKAKASMLTVDLVGKQKLPGVHCTAVAVV